MAERIVWRVEDDMGEGPFNNVRVCIGTPPGADRYSHPGINSDLGDNGIDMVEVCGLPSPDLVEHWFPEHAAYYRHMLEEYEFKVCMFAVNEEHVRDGRSGKQLAFNRSKARLVKRVPFTKGWQNEFADER